MDILIQNTSSAPIFVSITTHRDGRPVALPRVVFEPDKQITKISEELYQYLLKHEFYRSKLEQGVLVALNGQGGGKIDDAVRDSIQVKELNYAKYVSLVNRINATGGVASAELRPFLDAEGMPSIPLCQKNISTTIDPQAFEEFRSRYLVEKASGMHESLLILPTGNRVNVGAEDVRLTKDTDDQDKGETNSETKEEKPLDEYSLEELKVKADELKVEYDENVSFKRLLARVKRAMNNEEE